MVSYFGMSERIGNVSFFDSTGQSDFGFSKPYSEKTAEAIDEEVKKLIDKAYNKAKKILVEHEDGLDKLAKKLLEDEVIFKEDLERIFGKRPFDDQKEEKPAPGKRISRTKTRSSSNKNSNT
jgi:cell division protease FtsH